jgi:hypothetical protein
MGKFKFSDNCPTVEVMVKEGESKLFVKKKVKAVQPFGPQSLVTEDKLDQNMVNFLNESRPELAKFVEEIEEPKPAKK